MSKVIDGLAGQVAAVHGDISERVGRQAGPGGTQRGDQLITLSCDDTWGRDGRFIIEAKDRKMGRSKAFEELAECLANHDAAAGIIVFAGQHLAPAAVPFAPNGNKAILVVDKDDADPRVFQLAYMWARWVVRRSLADDTADQLDHARIQGAINAAQQALTILQVTKAALSGAKKKIDEAAEHISRLVREVDTALKILREELS